MIKKNEKSDKKQTNRGIKQQRQNLNNMKNAYFNFYTYHFLETTELLSTRHTVDVI